MDQNRGSAGLWYPTHEKRETIRKSDSKHRFTIGKREWFDEWKSKNS